ncbi:cytotoxic and regulatory T-cell molecule isoform X2 [Pseudophryne corroboree]|uniref:cytotoxic and regulatory T-cell molecule isoform X2 n=1 Tax=Pseudophryne corroboree TaxID=495146 RepID=UPI003081E127
MLGAEFHASRLAATEGGTVTLRCKFPRGDHSAMQWLTPRGYVAFLNGEKVLKDRRFQLVRHLRNTLIIRLSNITIADSGVYTCFYFSSPVQSQKVEVTVLAVPSQPVIEVTHIPGRARKDEYAIHCRTVGSWPCPRLTWLVDGSHTEVFGNKNNTIDSDGKRCAASSTLRINAYTHTSTAICVVRHRTLSSGNLTASFMFSVLSTVTESPITQREMTAQAFPHSTDAAASAPSSERRPTLSPDAPTGGAGEGASAGTVTLTAIAERNTLGSDIIVTSGHGTTEAVTLILLPEGNTISGTDEDTTTKDNKNISSDLDAFRRKSDSTLVLVLVSLMICVLLVIVHLFLMKLKKAHSMWKKENETSDQTLDSTKSKCNEDATGQAKNVCLVTTSQNVTGIQYNNQVSIDAEAPCQPPTV